MPASESVGTEPITCGRTEIVSIATAAVTLTPATSGSDGGR